MTNFYTSYIEPLTTWLNLHPNWAGIITFLISFSESLAIIGSIVPGSVTMTAIGMLIGTGVIPSVPIFIWAVLGAIAGDSASYFLGYYFHEKIAEYWPFRKYPKMFISGKNFFSQHGGKSVFIGRFLGPLRSIIPMIAGMMRMPNTKFLIANVTSAILWSGLYILPGILIGTAASELSPHLATKLFLYTLAIITALWLITCIIKYLFAIIKTYIDNHLQTFWFWISKHKKLESWAALISNPNKPHDHRQIALLLGSLLFILLFILIAISASNNGWITTWDQQVFNFLQSIRLPITDKIFMVFSFIGDKKTLIVLVFSLFFYLIYKEKKWEAVHWLSNGIISAILIVTLKPFIALARPTGLVQIRHGSSFPSGHTTFSIAVFGFLFYLLAKNTSSSMRRFILLPGALLLSCIAFSRIYLGMHWLSDIIGSILLASSILFIHVLSYQRSEIKKINVKSIALYSFLVVSIVSGFFMFNGLNKKIKASQLKRHVQINKIDNWWNDTIKMPTHRKNRLGADVAPLNIQWAMPLKEIQSILKKNNWINTKNISLSKKFKNFLTTNKHKMPLFHKLYRNQKPSLLMIKNNLVIRLWPSSIKFCHSKISLWIGTISYLKHDKTLALAKEIKTNMKSQENYLPSDMLAKELNGLKIKSLKQESLKEVLMITNEYSLSEHDLIRSRRKCVPDLIC